MQASRSLRIVSGGLIILVSVALLTYVIAKARLSSFTHDESFTYLGYVHQSFMDIISYKTAYTNNHILNSVMMKYAEALWGSSELVLRLPNILACLIYLVYSFRILKSFPAWLLVPGFLCFICHTQLCDFFSLARGYGLSLAFMLVSLYHLERYFRKAENRQLILFNAGALLAILANFSLINFYLSTLVAYNLFLFAVSRLERRPFRFWRWNRIHAWSLLAFIAVLYEPVRRISKQGMLNFGGKEGFFENTFGSLVSGAFYETPLQAPLHHGIVYGMTALLFAGGLLAGRQLYRKNLRFFAENRYLCLSWMILVGIAALSYLQHLLIQNDFYAGRFALFVYPLLMCYTVALLAYIFRHGRRLSAGFALYTLAALLTAGLWVNANLYVYKDWTYDAGTKSAMVALLADHRAHQAGRKLTLGVNWLFEPTTNFYRYTWDLDWLYPTHRRGASANDDYYYLCRTDTNAYLAAGKPELFFSREAGAFLSVNRKE